MAFLPPLHVAASHGVLPMVEKLVKAGHHTETPAGQGRTPLMWAVLRGHEKVARYLLDVMTPESLGAIDVGGDNVLHYMAVLGRLWLDVWADICRKCPDALRHKTKFGRRATDVIRRWRTRSEEHKKLWQFVCKQEYQKGVAENFEETSNITITFIGHEGVGKTCLVKQLLDEKIPEGGPGSTDTANLLTNHLYLNQNTKLRKRVKEGTELESGRQRLRRVIKRYSSKADIYLADVTREGSNEETLDKPATDTSTQHDSQASTPSPTNIPTNPLPEMTEISLDPTQEVSEDQMKAMETVMEAVKDDGPMGFVTIYDFGGEKIFYNTHHCLLSSDMIFMLVFDVAMCLDPVTEKEGYERIEFWLRSIATYAIDKDESELGTPPIILVGSHMDMVTGTKEEKNAKFGTVLEKLYEKPAIRNIMENHVQEMYHIDNMEDSTKNRELYQQIWDKVVDVAHLQSQWKALIPARWLALEQELMKNKCEGVNLLTFQELITINSALVVPLPTDDLRPFLLNLHMTGSILSYGLEGASPVIMLKPQWMINAFKAIITAPKFRTKLPPKDMLRWKEYERTGKMSFAFLKGLWAKEADSGYLEMEEILCTVMECLGLVSKPLPEEVKNEVNFYIVPCMLQTSAPDMLEPLLVGPAIAMTPVLCIEFENPFIPQAIWDKVIAACIIRFPPITEQGYDGSKFIQREMVCLSVDHKWNMILHCLDNAMKVAMFKTEKEGCQSSMAGAGVKLQNVLDYLLTKILKMNHQSHLEFDYFLHNDYRFTEDERRVRASDLCVEAPLRCYGATGTQWLGKEDYAVWFLQTDEEGRLPNTDQGSDTCVPDRKPTTREISRLSQYIDGSFQMFFMSLGCPSQLIDQTLMEYRYLSFRSIVTRILITLCNRCPDVHLPHISSAMKEHGMDCDAVSTVVEQCGKPCEQVKGVVLSEKLLDMCPMLDDVPTVVGYIGKTYFNLFLELGFDATRLDQFDLTFPCSDVKAKLIAMTTAWIQDTESRPTVNKLLLAMQDCDMDFTSLADRLNTSLPDRFNSNM